MKKTIEQIQKVLDKVNEIKVIFESYESENDIIIKKDSSNIIPTKEVEFKHLVYRYDSKMPLNKHLAEPKFNHGYYPSYTKMQGFLELVKFFIEYLNEDIENLKNL